MGANCPEARSRHAKRTAKLGFVGGLQTQKLKAHSPELSVLAGVPTPRPRVAKRTAKLGFVSWLQTRISQYLYCMNYTKLTNPDTKTPVATMETASLASLPHPGADASVV